MTFRDNAKQPGTIAVGTNKLIGTNPEAIGPAMKKLFSENWGKGGIPEKCDGQAAVRIVDALIKTND